MAQDTPPSDPQAASTPESMPDWLRQTLNDSPLDDPAESASDALPDWFAALETPADQPDLSQLLGSPSPAPITNPAPASALPVPPVIPPPAIPDVLDNAPAGSRDNAPLGLPAQAPRTLRERADQPRPIPAPEDDLPAWMREIPVEDKVSQPVTPPPSAPKAAAKPATKSPIPAAQPVPPRASPPAPATPPISDEPNIGGLIGGEISSADIDALINLPMDTYSTRGAGDDVPDAISEQDLSVLYGDMPANVTYVEPPQPTSNYDYGLGTPSPAPKSAEDLLSLDDASLDRLLGPMDPSAPDASPTSRMKDLASTVVPLTGRSDSTTARQSLLDPDRPAVQAEDLPDFVSELRPADAPVQLSVGGQTLDVEEMPAAELDPALQQLRERSRAQQQFRPSPKSTVGPLSDIEGTLVAEPALIRAVVNATGTPRVTAPDAIPTVDQLHRVDVLKRLLDVEEATYASSHKKRARPRVRIDGERLIVSVILMAALLAPFFTDKLNLAISPAAAGLQPTAAQAAAFKALDTIQQGQSVVVAFDYGPTAVGELDDLAVEMLHEVFVHGGHPFIVSTDSAGLLHAEGLLANFGRDPAQLAALNHAPDKPLLNPTDYTILRYLSGGSVGVRSLAEALDTGSSASTDPFLAPGTYWTIDAQGQLASSWTADQFAALHNAPVIVLAETSDEVRVWVEQFRPQVNNNDSPPQLTTPPTLILATTAAAAITAQAYSAADPTRVVGPLVGLRDAIAYRVLRPAANTTAPNAPVTGINGAIIGSSVTANAAVLDQRWQSVGLAALVAALLIVVGGLFGVLTRLRQRRKR